MLISADTDCRQWCFVLFYFGHLNIHMFLWLNSREASPEWSRTICSDSALSYSLNDRSTKQTDKYANKQRT
jgi:hypothetical protein